MESNKVYVEVVARFDKDGVMMPMAFVWEDDKKYDIDKVKGKERCANRRAGGTGIMYTVVVSGKECQEMINENMAYALQYMDAYDYRMDIGHLRKEMNNLMLIYGLCDMIHRAMTLLKYFTPKSGEEYYEIIYTCFCRSKRHTDTDVMLELGMSRATFYRKKKEALRYLGYYFFDIVVPQSRSKRYKPSFSMYEE